MKKFQELLMKDLGWKLLSVAIAAIMWFMVINITQPVDTRSYSTPLSIANIETLTNRGLTVGNLEELRNTKINVKVKAQRTALDRLNQNPEWITATVDLSELAYAVNGDALALPVTVSVQGGGNTYSISSKSPAVVEISVETLASRELPVEVYLEGEPEKGTYLSEPKLSVETVTITGPSSAVNRVTKVSTTIHAEDVKENPIVHGKLHCYDAQGTEVKGVFLSVEEVTVSYGMHDIKEVPIQVEITGNPAGGYQIDTVSCTPQYVQLAGAPEKLNRTISLQLDGIDVSGARSTVKKTFTLADFLPEDITLADPSNKTVTVVVEITASPQTQKQITIPSSRLSILGEENGKTYTLHGDARVSVTGDGSALDKLDADTLRGTIYVSGLSEGNHKVMVYADLPNGVSLSPSYITVTVTDDADASTNE